MANAWNEGTWGQGLWGQQNNQTVELTGLSTSFSQGSPQLMPQLISAGEEVHGVRLRGMKI